MQRVVVPPVVCREGDLRELPCDLGLLHPAERAAVERAVPTRIREFVAGRVLARRAIAELGFEAASIPRRSDRSPRWPRGIVGSISHHGSRCAVAVASAAEVLAIGVDLASTEPLTAEAEELVCHPEEIDGLPHTSDPGLWPKLVFSVKEAAYKAQYPITGAFLEFSAMRVSVEVDGGWTARFRPGSRPPTCPWQEIRGRWVRDGASIATAAVVSRVAEAR